MYKILICVFLIIGLQSTAQSGLSPGEVAPQIRITDYLKNPPADMSLQGKYVVIDFWATWCSGCLAGVPELNKMVDKYKSRTDVAFLSMTYESPKVTRHVLDRIDFKSIVVSDRTRATFKNFGLEDKGYVEIPRLVLIDKSGKIYYNDYMQDDLGPLMEAFLSDKPFTKPAVASVDGSILPREKGIWEGLYNKLYSGSEMLFEVTDVTGQFFITMSHDTLAGGYFLQLNTKASDVFDVLYDNTQTVVLPESLQDKMFTVLFRNPVKLLPDEHKALLKKLVLAHFKLKETQKLVPADVYTLKLQDKTKLIPAEENEPHAGVNETHLIVGGPVSDLVKEIYTTDQITVIDETGLDGHYEFLIDRGSPEAYAKSLQSYGLSLEQERREIPTIFLN